MIKNKFKKILVPLDGSAKSTKALSEAISLARQCDSIIFSIHVISKGPFFTGEKIQELRNFQVKTATKILETAKSAAAKNGVDLQGKILRENDIRIAISDFVKDKKCDIIVMGSRGTANTPGMFLGTTAYGVVNTSKVPVLIVR
jgi:nucleotide-binding universal stress UspA family protein